MQRKTSSDPAVEFLQKLRPGGPWVLTAIVPDGLTETITATTTGEVDLFVRARDGRCNLYYQVNPTKAAVSKKAAKKDIAFAEYLYTDLDPRDDETTDAAKARYLQAIAAFEPAATAIVDSGNGIQGLWKLSSRIALDSAEKIADVEARTKTLILRLGGDAGTQNVDRVLRLPGTTNLPNAKKRKAGRVECQSRLISFNGAAHPLDAFAREAEQPRKDEKRDGGTKSKRKLPRDLINMLHLSGDKPAGYNSRSHLLYAFLCEAMRKAVDDNEIIEACLDPLLEGCSIHDHVAENGGRDYVKRQIEHAVNDAATTDGGKQVIPILPGNRFEAWRATQRAILRNPKCQVFHRADILVEPLWRWEKTFDGKDVLVAKFLPYTVLKLSDVVARHAAVFVKHTAGGKQRRIDPPDDVIKTLLTRGDWDFPSVVGIINTPTMRPDGSLLTQPGYDPATRLWYMPAADVKLPPIPERPTKEDAQKSLELLEGLLREFPFVGRVDKSVALAGVMTPVLRGAFDHAPMFFIVAPESGTGKSYLVKLTSVIATGRPAPAVVAIENKEEMEKRLGVVALQALVILSLNNLAFDLDSTMLSQMITDDVVKIRILGKSEMVDCDCRGMTVFANGNNIRLVGDLVRRAVTARMDAKSERPETREFTSDPIEMVLVERAKYLAAIFTITRAYMAAGEPVPDDTFPLDGFEGWSRKVRYALTWLGMPDPVESMEEARALDPQREALRDLIVSLAKHMGVGIEFTAADVWHQAMIMNEHGTPVNQELFDALRRDGKKISAKSIGNTLMSIRGKVASDLRVEVVSMSTKTANKYKIAGALGPEDEESM